MKEISFTATIKNVGKVTDWVNLELEKINCPVSIKSKIDIAIDEIFSNIANYAYNSNIGEVIVKIEVDEKPKAVEITFMDKGMPYNPLLKENPNTNLPINDREEGGLGIFIVKKSMDSIEYDYKDGYNILKIKKNV